VNAPNGTRPRGQSGFVLAFALASLGLIMVLATALLAMTFTALRVSAEFRDGWAAVAAADGAIEQVIADLRTDDDAALVDCFGAGDEGPGHPFAYRRSLAVEGATWEVVVDCETASPVVDTRDIILRATVVSGPGAFPHRVLGASRLVITDRIGNDVLPGHSVEVCDWQLGQNVKDTLAPC